MGHFRIEPATECQLEGAGVCWDTSADFSPELPDVFNRYLRGDFTLIKESPAKQVVKILTPRGTWFLKVYRHDVHWARPWKYCFKQSPARQEYNLAQHLVDRNIPVVEHCAVGELRKGRRLLQSLLITREFPGLEVGQLPRSDLPGQELLRLVNQLHDAGVLQEDLHAANLLYNVETRKLALVDLDGVKLLHSLSLQTRQHNLATLAIHLPLPMDPALHGLAMQVRRKALIHRSRRCLKRNRHFYQQKLGGVPWHIRASALSNDLEIILRDPEGTVAAAQQAYKRGQSTHVVAVGEWVVKCYFLRKWHRLFTYLFRPSHGKRSYLRGYHLELTSIPTPRVVASGERRWAGLIYRSFVVMEKISGESLGAWLRRNPSTHAQTLEMARRCGALLGQLHHEGFSHRDLKETNLMIQGDQVVLIDLDGLDHYSTGLPPKRATQDLVRFVRGVRRVRPTIRFAEMRAFLRGYRNPPPPPWPPPEGS